MTLISDVVSDNPEVTILMASYGRLEYLKIAVKSVLNQSYSNYQVIIVDDGSDDDVIDWLKLLEAENDQVNVIFQEHQGVAAARVNGLNHCTSELVCILDSDDEFEGNALIKLVGVMQRCKGIQIVFTDILEMKDNGETRIQRYKQFDSTHSMTLATLLTPRVPFKHSGTLFRRQTALALGGYDINLPCKIDIDFFLKFLAAGYLPVHCDEPVVSFRMHKKSISINRLLGIKVWMRLIDLYGPRSVVIRLGIKLVRVSAEVLKRIYVEFRA